MFGPPPHMGQHLVSTVQELVSEIAQRGSERLSVPMRPSIMRLELKVNAANGIVARQPLTPASTLSEVRRAKSILVKPWS